MFQPEKVQAYLRHISEHRLPVEDTLKRNIFKCGLWLLGIPAIIYGAVDRGISAFSKPTVQVTDISYCLIILVILFGWLFMDLSEEEYGNSRFTKQNDCEGDNLYISTTSSPPMQRIAQQSYRLPFPYICQIYHLLNLKHLEEIHRFSLGNLKVIQVSHFRKTQMGGQIRFKTMLDSPFNVLRMWRNPSAEIDLTIHSPHQIELKVPAYKQKFIHVLFNVFPLNANEHQLVIQMFSNLQWPRELLRIILLFAASLTLLEDLPYLRQLAKRYTSQSGRISNIQTSCQTMQLFRRYIDLYDGYWEHKQLQSSRSRIV